MTSDQTTPAQREIGKLFLDGQGWGFGGSVDVAAVDPWNVMGRYGWVGGTGTSAHIIPSTGTVAILFSQVATDGPASPEWLPDFWRYAARGR
jgi:CubicO group peptidase (beta-lactamase class C family)